MFILLSSILFLPLFFPPSADNFHFTGAADFQSRSDNGSDAGASTPVRRNTYSHIPPSFTGAGAGAGAGAAGAGGGVGDPAAINAHLAVKHTDLQAALSTTLNDYPTGEESDTICTIVAANPHISVIVDQAVKLAAGTELFTVIVGPKVKVPIDHNFYVPFFLLFLFLYYVRVHVFSGKSTSSSSYNRH